MKINFQKFNFKGYDALPLKSVYLEDSYCSFFVDEMESIAKKEGFTIDRVYDNDKWIQDRKTIVEKEGRPYLLADGEVSKNFMSQMRRRGTQGRKTYGFLVGGDTFIGKFPNGEKWLITGKNTGDIPEGYKKEISEAYGVKKENIFEIPKQNFHLDMCIRPIGFPYVLVDDPDLVDENIKKISENSKRFEDFLEMYEYWKQQIKINYAGCDEMCGALEEIGFIPIRIAGVYGREVNFMNGIINKHKDGTISYITNSSDTGIHDFYKKIENMFVSDVRKAVPDLSEIYFVCGKTPISYDDKLNYMMTTLCYQNGGLHCMSLEEPDFEVWA